MTREEERELEMTQEQRDRRDVLRFGRLSARGKANRAVSVLPPIPLIDRRLAQQRRRAAARAERLLEEEERRARRAAARAERLLEEEERRVRRAAITEQRCDQTSREKYRIACSVAMYRLVKISSSGSRVRLYHKTGYVAVTADMVLLRVDFGTEQELVAAFLEERSFSSVNDLKQFVIGF